MPLHLRTRRATFVALMSSLVAITAPVAAQSTLRDHLDPVRMRSGRDSFVVMMQGAPRGSQRLTMERTPNGWEVSDSITIEGMVSQGSTVTLDAALHERALRQAGQMMGRDMKIALEFSNGRVRGTAMTPSSGPTGSLQIDTTMVTGLVDDNAVTPLLSAIRYRDSLDFTFPVIASGKGTISQYRIRVTGRETITVPAGQFDTWRVELQADRSRLFANITSSAPYRVVKMSNGPAFEMLLK